MYHKHWKDRLHITKLILLKLYGASILQNYKITGFGVSILYVDGLNQFEQVCDYIDFNLGIYAQFHIPISWVEYAEYDFQGNFIQFIPKKVYAS